MSNRLAPRYGIWTKLHRSNELPFGPAWDRLLPDGELYSSPAWLTHLNDAAGSFPVLTCWNSAEPVGLAPLWEPESDDFDLFDIASFFPDVPGPWHERFLWLGARRSVHNVLPSAQGPKRALIMRRLLETALEEAEAGHRGGVIMPYMPMWAAQELAESHPGARMLVHAAEATMIAPSGGSGEFAGWTTSRNRKRRRQELRDFAATGHTIEYVPVTEEVIRIAAPLIARNRSKYGSAQGPVWMRNILAAQRRAGLLDNAVAIMCRRSDQVVSVALCYQHGNVLHGRYYGSNDSESSRRGKVYFVTTLHAPLQFAADRGLRQVNVGPSSLEAKAMRGARLEPLAAVVLTRSTETPDLHSVQSHNKRFAQSFAQRFESHTHALAASWGDFM